MCCSEQTKWHTCPTDDQIRYATLRSRGRSRRRSFKLWLFLLPESGRASANKKMDGRRGRRRASVPLSARVSVSASSSIKISCEIHKRPLIKRPGRRATCGQNVLPAFATKKNSYSGNRQTDLRGGFISSLAALLPSLLKSSRTFARENKKPQTVCAYACVRS